MTFIEKSSSDQLQHYGIPGMKWGQRKLQAIGAGGSAPALPNIKAAAHGLRKEAGLLATREMLIQFGHLTVPAAKAAGKTVGKGIKLARYGPRVARGAGTAIRIMGSGAKLVGKGGKAYLKGAVTVAKMVR